MKVFITGGHGFLGKYVCNKLVERGYEIDAPTHAQLELTDIDAVSDYLYYLAPDAVIHLGALCGGIGANSKRPGTFFYENIMMGVPLIESARKNGVKKFVALGTVCAYPKHTPIPFKEESLWYGYPEETNAPYGLAKKMLLVQAQAYREQYGFNAIYLLPVNLYGPGDNFNPESSHVIPALIRKFQNAIDYNENEVVVWGTGKASREFLYVEDCAEGICRSLEIYDEPEPMNLGTGKDITINELVYMIKDLMEYEGNIIWDKSKPDGQPRRCLDISRAKEEIEWNPKYNLSEGLKITIDWWRSKSGSCK